MLIGHGFSPSISTVDDLTETIKVLRSESKKTTTLALREELAAGALRSLPMSSRAVVTRRHRASRAVAARG